MQASSVVANDDEFDKMAEELAKDVLGMGKTKLINQAVDIKTEDDYDRMAEALAKDLFGIDNDQLLKLTATPAPDVSSASELLGNIKKTIDLLKENYEYLKEYKKFPDFAIFEKAATVLGGLKKIYDAFQRRPDVTDGFRESLKNINASFEVLTAKMNAEFDKISSLLSKVDFAHNVTDPAKVILRHLNVVVGEISVLNQKEFLYAYRTNDAYRVLVAVDKGLADKTTDLNFVYADMKQYTAEGRKNVLEQWKQALIFLVSQMVMVGLAYRAFADEDFDETKKVASNFLKIQDSIKKRFGEMEAEWEKIL